MDSNLDNVKIIMADDDINATRHFACGDIKEIFSRKIFR